MFAKGLLVKYTYRMSPGVSSVYLRVNVLHGQKEGNLADAKVVSGRIAMPEGGEGEGGSGSQAPMRKPFVYVKCHPILNAGVPLPHGVAYQDTFLHLPYIHVVHRLKIELLGFY
jgi:hypothetical protein